MNNLMLFENNEFGSVRVVIKDDEVWFVAKDVCDVLGLKNSRKAVNDINLRMKKAGLGEVTASYPLKTNGGMQELTMINEQGLYELIFNSKKENAIKFRAWITSEVLPTTRKTLTELESIEFSGNIDGLVYSRNGEQITTSRIIADVANKRHKHVLRDIEDEISKLKSVHGPNLGSELDLIINDFKKTEYVAENGQTYNMYELGKMATLQILLRYSSEIRAKFIIAYYKLENTLKKMYQARVIESVLPQKGKLRQYVYIIKNPENDRIKIGVAQNVDKRIKQLETGAGTELELVYKSIVMSNAYEVEKILHKYFEEYRVHGEWFEVNYYKVIDVLENQRIVLKSEFNKILGGVCYE